MLLTTLTLCRTRAWLLDLTGWPPGRAKGPCVYALVATRAPFTCYIGATKHLEARLRQHLAGCRAHLARPRDGSRARPSAASAVLAPVVTGKSGLLVLRLERVPSGNRRRLRLVELSWLLVATREELATPHQRGPQIEWTGDPGELRKAFALARKRHWPSLWVRALKPLCENRSLPDPPPAPPHWPWPGRPKGRSKGPSKARAAPPLRRRQGRKGKTATAAPGAPPGAGGHPG